MYFTNRNDRKIESVVTVMRANLDGGHAAATRNRPGQTFGITIDATAVYWTNLGDGTVMRVRN